MFSNNNSPKGFVGTSFVISDGIFLWIWSLMYHYSKLFPHRLLFIQSNRSQSNQTLLYSCSEKIQNNLSKLYKMYNFLGLSVFTFQICLTLMFPDFCVEDQVIISFFNAFFLFCIAPQVQPKIQIQIILHFSWRSTPMPSSSSAPASLSWCVDSFLDSTNGQYQIRQKLYI